MAVITSPDFSPAFAAGLCGAVPGLQATGCLVLGASWKSSFTQLATLASRAGDVLPLELSGMPMKTNRIQSVTNARMKCVTDPADMTIVRSQPGNRHIARF